jgi:hypothetical protein
MVSNDPPEDNKSGSGHCHIGHWIICAALCEGLRAEVFRPAALMSFNRTNGLFTDPTEQINARQHHEHNNWKQPQPLVAGQQGDLTNEERRNDRGCPTDQSGDTKDWSSWRAR